MKLRQVHLTSLLRNKITGPIPNKRSSLLVYAYIVYFNSLPSIALCSLLYTSYFRSLSRRPLLLVYRYRDLCRPRVLSSRFHPLQCSVQLLTDLACYGLTDVNGKPLPVTAALCYDDPKGVAVVLAATKAKRREGVDHGSMMFDVISTKPIPSGKTYQPFIRVPGTRDAIA